MLWALGNLPLDIADVACVLLEFKQAGLHDEHHIRGDFDRNEQIGLPKQQARKRLAKGLQQARNLLKVKESNVRKDTIDQHLAQVERFITKWTLPPAKLDVAVVLKQARTIEEDQRRDGSGRAERSGRRSHPVDGSSVRGHPLCRRLR